MTDGVSRGDSNRPPAIDDDGGPLATAKRMPRPVAWIIRLVALCIAAVIVFVLWNANASGGALRLALIFGSLPALIVWPLTAKAEDGDGQ